MSDQRNPAGDTSRILRNQQPVYRLTLMDIVTLLWNIHAGAQNPEVGFEDANNTLETLTQRLDARRFEVDESVLESALWSANLLDEREEFWDPKGRTFDQFVVDVLGRAGFDRKYNVIKRKES